MGKYSNKSIKKLEKTKSETEVLLGYFERKLGLTQHKVNCMKGKLEAINAEIEKQKLEQIVKDGYDRTIYQEMKLIDTIWSDERLMAADMVFTPIPPIVSIDLSYKLNY